MHNKGNISVVKKLIMDSVEIERTISRMAHEIIERNRGAENIGLIGIQSRGDIIALKIKEKIEELEDVIIDTGVLDITLYRDDLTIINFQPVVHKTEINFDLIDRKVILVDDVIFTGRTIRAALDAVLDHGRPSCIQLAVLIDRGHRELPISPDYVGKIVPTSKKENIEVTFHEEKGLGEVFLVSNP